MSINTCMNNKNTIYISYFWYFSIPQAIRSKWLYLTLLCWWLPPFPWPLKSLQQLLLLLVPKKCQNMEQSVSTYFSTFSLSESKENVTEILCCSFYFGFVCTPIFSNFVRYSLYHFLIPLFLSLSSDYFFFLPVFSSHPPYALFITPPLLISSSFSSTLFSYLLFSSLVFESYVFSYHFLLSCLVLSFLVFSFLLIVARLAAIEDMAGMSILCSDKTGTLTMNKMEIQDETPIYKVRESDITCTTQIYFVFLSYNIIL